MSPGGGRGGRRTQAEHRLRLPRDPGRRPGGRGPFQCNVTTVTDPGPCHYLNLTPNSRHWQSDVQSAGSQRRGGRGRRRPPGPGLAPSCRGSASQLGPPARAGAAAQAVTLRRRVAGPGLSQAPFRRHASPARRGRRTAMARGPGLRPGFSARRLLGQADAPGPRPAGPGASAAPPWRRRSRSMIGDNRHDPIAGMIATVPRTASCDSCGCFGSPQTTFQWPGEAPGPDLAARIRSSPTGSGVVYGHAFCRGLEPIGGKQLHTPCCNIE